MTAVGIPLDRRVGAQAPPRRSRYRPTRPILFVVPAFNEVDNLPRLFADLEAHRRMLPAGSRVIIVDDGSEDGTDLLVENYGGPLPVELVRLPENQGPGAAFRAGFAAALDGSKPSSMIVTLEADTTSDLDAAPGDARARGRRRRPRARVRARRRHDGQRQPQRRLLSRGAGAFVRLALGLDARTVSSFYRVYRAGLLRDAQARYGDKLIEEPGFACKAELLAKLSSLGARIEEVPVSVDASRRVGKSKMRIGPTIRGYWRLARRSEDRDAVVV